MKKISYALETVFRRGVVYPLLRLMFRNRVSDETIDLGTVKRLLILRHDRIGDMIITTPILRALKRRNPQLWLGVIASRSNAEIIRNSPHVDELVILESNWIKLMRQIVYLRRRQYDVVLDFVFNRTTGPAILANLIAPKGFKVGHGSDRYSFYFNRLLTLRRFEQHMVESLASFVEQVFGTRIPYDELAFEINVDRGTRQHVDDFLNKHHLRRRSFLQPDQFPYFVLNLSAVDSERRISTSQGASIVDHLCQKTGFRTVLLYAPGDEEMRRVAESKQMISGCVVYSTQGTRPLGEIASLVEGAILVITPDTSIVHFASAMKTPVLALYTELQGMREWLPYDVPHEIVVAPKGEPASSIGLATLVRKTDEFITSLTQSGLKATSEAI